MTVTNAFQKCCMCHSSMDEPGRKPNKIWLGQGSEFYNRSIKSWLHDNKIEMYSSHNEWKSVVAERFIRMVGSTSIWLQYQKMCTWTN